MQLRWQAGFAFAAIVLTWTGCCNQPEEFHYPIRPEVQAMVPYNLTSQFDMRYSSGQTVRFHTVWENESEVTAGACNDCCTKEFGTNYYLHLQADSTDLQANIQLTQSGQEGVLAPTKFQITLDGAVYFADFTDGNCLPQDGLACIDSVTVLGHTYFDVLEFKNQSTANGAPDTRLLYDPTVGIIRFTERGTAEYWELQR